MSRFLAGLHCGVATSPFLCAIYKLKSIISITCYVILDVHDYNTGLCWKVFARRIIGIEFGIKKIHSTRMAQNQSKSHTYFVQMCHPHRPLNWIEKRTINHNQALSYASASASANIWKIEFGRALIWLYNSCAFFCIHKSLIITIAYDC